MPDLRPGQYRRLGRIAETNPERAERVADRMKTRASRGERGKNIANKDEGFVRGVAKMYEEENPRERQQAIRKMTTAQGVQGRPDTPLADTPEPTRYK